MTRTITIDHLARIEGHAGITVELDGSRVERIECGVFEGVRLFEGLLQGRPHTDVSPLVSRVCAICSHGHAIVALEALEAALGLDVSRQTERLRDLGFQGANIESHALHVFCLALPDFTGHASVLALADADRDLVLAALRLKKLGNTIQEVVGGRAVHPVNYVIGGFSRLPTVDQLLRLREDLERGLEDCDRVVESLRRIPVPAFVHEEVRCAALVPAHDALFFGRAVQMSDGLETIPVDRYWRLTNEQAVPHSNAKHSREGGRSYMVGALARLTLNGTRIGGRARQVWDEIGPSIPASNVVMNNLAQVVEVVYGVERALELVGGFLDEAPVPEPPPSYEVRACRGAAAAEVPRGTLFHAYELDADGRVAAADVITPTAQNLAHLEDHLRATVRDAGDVSDEVLRHRLEIVARAYDPCVSCSVHVVQAPAHG